jgi:ribosome recycling factor
MRGVTFQEALEIIESLPEEQRESLLEIVKQRLTEERRDRLAHSIKEAREEYRKGKVKKGTVDDLLRDLEK